MAITESSMRCCFLMLHRVIVMCKSHCSKVLAESVLSFCSFCITFNLRKAAGYVIVLLNPRKAVGERVFQLDVSHIGIGGSLHACGILSTRLSFVPARSVVRSAYFASEQKELIATCNAL